MGARAYTITYEPARTQYVSPQPTALFRCCALQKIITFFKQNFNNPTSLRNISLYGWHTVSANKFCSASLCVRVSAHSPQRRHRSEIVVVVPISSSSQTHHSHDSCTQFYFVVWPWLHPDDQGSVNREFKNYWKNFDIRTSLREKCFSKIRLYNFVLPHKPVHIPKKLNSETFFPRRGASFKKTVTPNRFCPIYCPALLTFCANAKTSVPSSTKTEKTPRALARTTRL